MKIQTFFFDLGGVLVNFSHEKMCQNIACFCDLDLNLVKKDLFEKKIGEKYERGDMDSQDVYQYFSQLSQKKLDFTGLMFAASDIFSLKNEMIDLLHQLKHQNAHLYLLSNTCEAHFLYIKKTYSFLDLFDGFILSYEVHARKPEKKIYKTAVKRANVPIEQCFYIDDIAKYVETASSFGLQGHHFQEYLGLKNTLKTLGY